MAVAMESVEKPHPLSWKARLVLALFGLLVSALVAEVALRIVGTSLKPKTWTDRPYAYFLPAGAHTLQDADPSPKVEGTYRIVVVGDSFTFGPNMQLVDTFPKKLEQMLNLNKNAPRVEVLNRGVCGASTVTEVENVRAALQEQPDLLILEITLNDAEPHVLSKQEREELFEPRWLKWKIFTIWKSLGFIAARFHNAQTVRRYIDYHSKFFKDPKTREQFEIAIRRIVTQAKEAHVPVIAMVFPLFDFPVNAKYPFAETHEIIASALTSNGVGVVDLRKPFADVPPERLQVIPGVDNHPNEIAHRIAAERVLAAIAERGFIPPTALPQRVFRARTGMKSPSQNPAQTFQKFANIVISGTEEPRTEGAASGE